MQPYQEEYIANCERIRSLTFSAVRLSCASGNRPCSCAPDDDSQGCVSRARAKAIEAQTLTSRNNTLLEEYLLPALDDIYGQDSETLDQLETFADALTGGKQAIDAPLASQIHEALVSNYRHRNNRKALIRELYKLGMARYQLVRMLNGIGAMQANQNSLSMRMRYCFVEASSFLAFFDEFDEETKGYILRSLSNIYLGHYDDWHEKLQCIRRTREVMFDERYQKSAPGLPWAHYRRATTQQMAVALPYGRKGSSVSPDVVADVMDAAHSIYMEQYQKAQQSGQPLQSRWLLPYYMVEYSCGLCPPALLLERMETLMDQADEHCFDGGTAHAVVAMTVFYVQQLDLNPEMYATREDYITELYRRILRYAENIPEEAVTDQIVRYFCQVCSLFHEIEGGVQYLHMIHALIRRFVPNLYIHGDSVGRMSRCIAGAILTEDPHYFDEVPELSQTNKREDILQFVYHAGMTHDLGMIDLVSLYSQSGRKVLRDEYEIRKLHTLLGHLRLSQCPSTRGYADIALGHHMWYDGSDGYPEDYNRSDSPYRAVTDIISLADYLDCDQDMEIGNVLHTRIFDECVESALKLSGRRFSPLVAVWLRNPDLCQQLRREYDAGCGIPST